MMMSGNIIVGDIASTAHVPRRLTRSGSRRCSKSKQKEFNLRPDDLIKWRPRLVNMCVGWLALAIQKAARRQESFSVSNLLIWDKLSVMTKSGSLCAGRFAS